METPMHILLSAIVLLFADAEGSPSVQKLKICDQNTNDTDVDECNRSAVEMAFRNFKDGNEDLGIVPFDPLVVPAIDFSYGTGPSAYIIKNTECELKGISTPNVISVTGSRTEEVVITRLRTEHCALTHSYLLTEEKTPPRCDECDCALGVRELLTECERMSPEEHGMKMILELPTFVMTGKYKNSGEMGGLTVNGNGHSTIRMFNVKTTISFKGDLVKNGCKLFLKFTYFSLEILPEITKFKLTNLFNGNEIMETMVHEIMNDLHQELFSEMEANINQELTRIFRPLFQKFYDKVSYDDLFPEFKLPCP